MLRNLFAAFLIASFLAQSALGLTINLIHGLPGSYTPGQPVSFDVRLPAVSNLGSYNIDLVLESSVGNAGTDFFFDLASTTPAATNYVFPTATNFFEAVAVDSAMRHRITLTDFDFAGANVVPGSNDRVAAVVLRTAASFSGPLSISVDAPLLILDTPDVTPTPVEGFEALQSGIAEAGPSLLAAVPEPTSWGIGLTALVTILFAKRHQGHGKV